MVNLKQAMVKSISMALQKAYSDHSFFVIVSMNNVARNWNGRGTLKNVLNIPIIMNRYKVWNNHRYVTVSG